MQTEMSRLFSGYGATTARDFPPINIWLGENSVVVTAELPGVTRDDVTISLQEDVLTLEGKREPKVQEDNVNWQRRERAYGISRARSSCRSGSMQIKSRRISITAFWKSSYNGWKRTGRRRSKFALHNPRGGLQSWPRKSGTSTNGHRQRRRIATAYPVARYSSRRATFTKRKTASSCSRKCPAWLPMVWTSPSKDGC
jgi:hypothetical protein